jgi:hypothetical protein
MMLDRANAHDDKIYTPDWRTWRDRDPGLDRSDRVLRRDVLAHR